MNRHLRRRCLVAAGIFLALACSGDRGSPSPPSSPEPPAAGDPPPSTPPPTPPPTGPAGPGWALVGREGFDGAAPAGAFAPDPVPDDGPFSDAGVFFTRRDVAPPAAFRASVPFGEAGWLTLEAYSRRAAATVAEHAAIVPDPADATNRVLRIASPEHTDAAVVRPTLALPERYRISLRVGFAAFGDGKAGPNGYDGGEKAGPWWPDEDATLQNGFYWLAILDQAPRPHNNTFIHHHRKVVIDSDNHFPPWMEVWDGARFLSSGEHPIMLFALDGTRPGNERSGPPFLSYSAGTWQPSGMIRAVDAYLPDTWYTVRLERDGPRYVVELSGRFRYGGETTYRAEIDAAARCVFHYPATEAEARGAGGCEDPGAFASVGSAHPRWPAGGVWPDFFMFGDPHANYYEGEVLYDDVTLEVWRD
jgi:hypothetical protein